jgi:hypothetical protein
MDGSDSPASEPSRTVVTGDGVAWLAANALPPTHAVVTSLPDSSEMRSMDFDAWQAWFVDTVALVCTQVADSAAAVFYQTDVKLDGRWIDKGHLVHLGADAAGSHLLWHKIICRVAPDITTFGRPAYAHMLCVSRGRTLPPGVSTPDVIGSLGEMTWSRATPTKACEAAVRFVASLGARVVVDPFCGVGTVLAIANNHGMNAIGVELTRRRAARARKLELPLIPGSREPSAG